MVKIVRLVTLVLEAILQQFINGPGIVALLVAFVAGYFRAPSWVVPALAAVFAVGLEFFEGWVDFSGKAASASERWAFVAVIYFLISLVGYLAGIFGRHYVERRKKAAPSR